MKKIFAILLLISVAAYAIDRDVTSRDGSVVVNGFTSIKNQINGIDKLTVTTSGLTLGTSVSLLPGLGTALLPAYSFTGDTNTGVWSPGADIWSVSTAGSERMRIGASGLTLGTSVSLLPGLGTVGAPSYSFTGDTDTGMWSAGPNALNFSVSGNEVVSINSSRFLGVGDTNPGVKVSIIDSSNATLTVFKAQQSNVGAAAIGVSDIIRTNNGAISASIGSTANGGNPAISTDAASGVFSIGSASSIPVIVKTGGTEHVRIDSTGRAAMGAGTNIISTGLQLTGAGETTAPADAGSKYATLRVVDNSNLGGSGGSVEFGGQSNKYFASIKGLLLDGAANTVGNLGFYTRNATADISLTERMRIDSAGQVGVGNTAPRRLMTVGPLGTAGNFVAANNAIVEILGNDAGVAANGSGQLRILSTNTVAIDSGGVISLGGNYLSAPNQSYPFAEISGRKQSGTNGDAQGYFSVATQTGGGLFERMRIDPSGNVGIGVSPSYNVHAKGAASAHANYIFETGPSAGYGGFLNIKNSSSVQGGLCLSNVGAGTTYQQEANMLSLSVGAGYGIKINTNGTDGSGLRIDSSGNVGLGVTPTELLTVGTNSAGATGRKAIKIGDGGFAPPSAFNTNSNGDKIILFSSISSDFDARIGVGDGADVWFKATNSTNTVGQFRFVTAGSERLLIASSGIVRINNLAGAGSRAVNANANGDLSAASDSRLKKEVVGTKLPGLKEVMKLEPKAYKWLDDIKKRGDKASVEIGFFADQVAPIIPSAAPKGNDGYYGFYDRSVTAALVNAVKELKAENDELKKRIEKLEAKFQ